MTGSIAICIPAYRGHFLASTLKSVISQTHPADEVIVLDDNSPDDLESIVSQFNYPGLRYVRNETNIGIPENYNRILRMARSDYVMLFGDHDIMLNTFIERHAEILDRELAVDFVFSAISAINDKGEIIRTYPTRYPDVFPGQTLIRHLISHTASPITLSAMIRKSRLDQLDTWFDSKYWWYADIDLWIRLSVDAKVGFVQEPVLQRRGYEEGHYLEDKHWQASLICDRIRNDNWHLGYPHQTLASRWASLQYAVQKDMQGFRYILHAVSTGDAKLPTQDQLHYMSLPTRALARIFVAMPKIIPQTMRTIHRLLFPRI